MANQGFTAADMADQGARQFEAGYAAAKAELHAAAQEAVAWQRKYLGATRGGRPVDWHNITREEFEQTKSGKWADKYDVRELFAAPVAAAPEGFLMVPVTPTDEMRDAGNVHIRNRANLFAAWGAMPGGLEV